MSSDEQLALGIVGFARREFDTAIALLGSPHHPDVLYWSEFERSPANFDPVLALEAKQTFLMVTGSLVISLKSADGLSFFGRLMRDFGTSYHERHLYLVSNHDVADIQLLLGNESNPSASYTTEAFASLLKDNTVQVLSTFEAALASATTPPI